MLAIAASAWPCRTNWDLPPAGAELERRHKPREDLRSLARLARRFGVAGIVVGNPVHLSGEVSPQAAKTQALPRTGHV